MTSGYRDTLRHCCRLAIKWMTIIYVIAMGVALLIPATYRDPSSIWEKLGSAVGLLFVLWLWGLVAAVLVSPVEHALSKRRALQAVCEARRNGEASN